MSFIFVSIGVILAVSIFLYFINLVDSGKRKIEELKNNKNAGERSSHSSTNNSGISSYTRRSKLSDMSEDLKDYMPGRRCPLCNSTLTRDEPLYASHVETFNEKKVLIHGCPYCYKNKVYSSSSSAGGTNNSGSFSA